MYKSLEDFFKNNNVTTSAAGNKHAAANQRLDFKAWPKISHPLIWAWCKTMKPDWLACSAVGRKRFPVFMFELENRKLLMTNRRTSLPGLVSLCRITTRLAGVISLATPSNLASDWLLDACCATAAAVVVFETIFK